MDADLLSWADIDSACGRLAGAIRGGGLPDVVVGISRGGLVRRCSSATSWACETCVPSPSSGPAATRWVRPSSLRLPVRYPASLGSLQDLDVLVVDDVAGSGETIAAAAGMATSMRAKRARAAVCVVNDANWVGGTLPDHVAIHARRWVIFPWEPRDHDRLLPAHLPRGPPVGDRAGIAALAEGLRRAGHETFVLAGGPPSPGDGPDVARLTSVTLPRPATGADVLAR